MNLVGLLSLASLGESIFIPPCTLPIITGIGFNVKFLDYDFNNHQVGFNSDGSISESVVEAGVTLFNQLGEAFGITDLNLGSTLAEATESSLEVFGIRLPKPHCALHFTGFYKPSVNGTHTFHLAAENQVSIQFGKGFLCPQDFDGQFTASNGFDITGEKYTQNAGVDADSNLHLTSQEAELVEGLFYPIRMIYLNTENARNFEASIVQPNGEILNNFANIFQLHF